MSRGAQRSLTLGVGAGLKHVELLRVLCEGVDFDHRVENYHDPGHQQTKRHQPRKLLKTFKSFLG